MKKILAITKYALLAISVVALAYVMFSGEESVDSAVGLILNWAAILLGLAVVATVVLPLLNLAQNPKGAMRSLIGIGIVVVVLAIAYAMSSTEPVVNSAGGFFTDPTMLKITDTELYTTYIALGAAILVVVAGEIRNSFK